MVTAHSSHGAAKATLKAEKLSQDENGAMPMPAPLMTSIAPSTA